VAVLCVLQFVWTLQQVGPSGGQWVFVTVNLLLAAGGFALLYRIGKERASELR